MSCRPESADGEPCAAGQEGEPGPADGSGPDESSQSTLGRARLGTAGIFCAQGVTGATWASRIPDVKDQLGLNSAALGIALLGIPVGMLCANRFVGRAIARWGSRGVSSYASPAAALTLVLPAFAWDLASLTVSLMLLGAAMGMAGVAMNAQGVAVERCYGRPVMSGLHGAFSVGTLAGALLGAAAARLGAAPLWQFAAVAALCASATRFCSRGLLGKQEDAPPAVGGGSRTKKPGTARRYRFGIGPRPVQLLGMIGLCSVVGESTVGSWSGVYLRESDGTSAGVAGLGFVGFSLAMAAGRLTSDRWIGRFGPARVVRTGAALAAVGLGLGLVAGHPAAAIVGFTAFGLGSAPVVPAAFSAAGRIPGLSASTALPRVTSITYLGLLAGPALIGFLAEAIGLGGSLAVPVLLAATVTLLAGAVRGPGEQAARAAQAQSAEPVRRPESGLGA